MDFLALKSDEDNLLDTLALFAKFCYKFWIKNPCYLVEIGYEVSSWWILCSSCLSSLSLKFNNFCDYLGVLVRNKTNGYSLFGE